MDGRGQARTGTDGARKLAENLTEQHELFIRLRGEHWREKLEVPKQRMRELIEVQGCSPLKALDLYLRAATKTGKICPGLVMTLSAACVEIIKEDGHEN